MKKIAIVLILSLSLAASGYSQCGGTPLTVLNPSFEGPQQPHVTPPNWDICMPGVTPDTQPGSWGITLPPTNGSSYLGLVHQPSSGWQEGAGQTLSSPMIAGTAYNFTIDLATTTVVGFGILPGCVELQLWGGWSGINSGCDMAELLWSSGNIYDPPHQNNWVTHTITFTPTQNFDHILFLINGLGCTDGPYIMIDNMTPLVPQSDVPDFVMNDNGIPWSQCDGMNVQFNDSSQSPQGTITNWLWDFDDGGTSTLQNPLHTFPGPGVYDVSLTIYSTVPCTTNIVIPVTIFANPTVTATASPASICNGGQSTLTGAGATTYSWSNGLGSGNPVSASPASTTTYTVTGTANNCSGTGSVTVTVAGNLTLNIVPANPTICIGDTVQLTASGAVNYNWSPGTGLSASTGAIVNAYPGVTTTYTVNGNDGAGCTGSSSVTVTLTGTLFLNVVPPNPNICNGDTVQLTASGATDYIWSPGSGLSATTGAVVNAYPGVTTTYTVNGSSGAGCTGSTTVTVTTTNGATPSVTPANPTICEGSMVTLTATGANTFTWAPNTGLSATSGNSVIATPLSTTTYTVIGTNGPGCSGSTTVTVTVANGTNIPFTAVPMEGCIPLEVQFSLIPGSNIIDSSWMWNFGDIQSPFNSSYDLEPTHFYVDEGYYYVTLSALTVDGCVATDTLIIRVFPFPVAEFSLHPGQVYMNDPTVNFYDQSIGATSWFWNFGDPNSLNDSSSYMQNPQHVYSDTGVFTITLVVTNDGGCSDTVSHTVIVYPELLIWIPSAFSPNGNHVNDFFGPSISGIQPNSYQMRIFDRWGKDIFYTTDLDAGWDGRVNGKYAQVGMYVWIINYTSADGKKYKQAGQVTLVR